MRPKNYQFPLKCSQVKVPVSNITFVGDIFLYRKKKNILKLKGSKRPFKRENSRTLWHDFFVVNKERLKGQILKRVDNSSN